MRLPPRLPVPFVSRERASAWPWLRWLAAAVAALSLLAGAAQTAQAQGPLCPACFSVSVIPDGAAESHYINTSGLLVTYDVQNTGGLSGTFTFTCSATGGLTCGTVTPGTATIAAGALKEVDVTYSVGASGGTLTLTASGPASDAGSYVITALTPPSVTLQVPTLTSGSRAVVKNRTPVIRAILLKGSLPLDTTKTALLWRTDTVTKWRDDSLTVARANRGLIEWEVDSIAGLNATGAADSALITARACDTSQQCTIVTRYAVLPNDSTPALSWLGTPKVVSNSIFSAPFGPGISVSGAEVETGFSTIPYFSMGSARSAGLVYSTRQSYPRVLVPVHLEVRGSTSPDQIKAVLIDGSTRMDSLVLTSPSCATGAAARCRLVLPGDFSGATFGTPTRKWLKVEVTVTKTGVARMSVDSIEAVIVDRRSTMYGSGWWPSALVKLVKSGNDQILVSPTGTATIYRGNGDSLYLPPVGSFVGLTKTASGWELRARGDSAVVRFDLSGRIRAAQDRNGNVDSLVYGNGGLDTLKQLRDPTAHTMTLAYNTTGKLSSITDAPGRVTRDSIDASNRLIYDSLASPATKPLTTRYTYQSYPGTNTVVLATRLGVLTDTTILVYDSTFKRRPVQVKLPLVQDPAGASVKPVIAYTAVESRGYGALVRTDSAGPYVELTDPLTNWTRSWLNRWGQAALTWDALGLLGRSRYAEDGRVLWSEGKKGADTTRTYYRYDSQQRLAKRYVNRVEGGLGILRVDSLVYDANHRVVKRIDSRDKADSVTYDARGNVLQTRDPGGFITKFWYRSDGLVDSTRAPGSLISTRYAYDAAWKQRTRTTLSTTPTITFLDSLTYDGYGRGAVSMQRIQVRSVGATTKYQWRKTVPYYNILNQADSTVLFRTDDCSPCTTPGTFVNDAAHMRKVGLRFDRGYCDSLRLSDNNLNRKTAYLYDRLGRVLRRSAPSLAATPPSDSMVYDLAGNVVKTITRRGDLITGLYDSRNRDTSTTIPGVGTIRKTYAGPLDQLTRIWYASLVDSIGDVNGEVSFRYDATGRLLSDTAFTGAIKRTTTYTYDSYDRPSLVSDLVGSWTSGYEANRGIPISLVTPFADTVSYAIDGQGRATTSPSTHSAGQVPITRTTEFPDVDADASLANAAPGYNAGTWHAGVYAFAGQPTLGPNWTEQHGAAAGIDSLVDSTAYDGWGRLVSWRQMARLSGAPSFTLVDSDSMWFDQAGNLFTTKDTRTYDSTTNQLTSGGPYGTYTYDAAGNLTVAGTWGYSYDGLNRLVSVRKSGTLIVRYGYDALGRRIAKRVYSSTTGGVIGYRRYLYHGAQVSVETDSVGTLKLKYIWGQNIDDLIGYQDSTGTKYFVVQDPLHSVRGLVTASGGWIVSQRFRPYGDSLAASGSGKPGLPYRWTGREYDRETGMYYHRARYYDPGQRRFTQEDPIGYGGGQNLYAYVGGGVLEARDPSGLIESGGTPEFFDQIKLGGEDPFGSGLDGIAIPDGGRRHESDCKVWESDGSCASYGDPSRYYDNLPPAGADHHGFAGSLGGSPIDRGTPINGSPNSSQTFRIRNGEQTRYFDSEGKAYIDIESGHHPELGPDHAHSWENGVRGAPRALAWFELLALGIARGVLSVTPLVMPNPCGASMRGGWQGSTTVCRSID